MTIKDFRFKRDFLKHTNFKNGYHVYSGMETVSDRSGEELPESVIKLLYRINAETAADMNHENKCEGE
ncbi:MAG: hypothetical protein IKL00_06600 [Oscillospiraceae bacterium]|nr:hypothetical protein [Ruminococcus sp.]MBR6617525.1 hypothetical protein [Oscillospiraceae bacterium]